MSQNTPPSSNDMLDPVEEAMARARLRRMRGRPVAKPPPPVGRTLRKVTRKHLKGTGSSLSKLQTDWDILVGEPLAQLCYPDKLSGAKSGRTLTLKVIPAAAALIQHQQEMIRQRVSVAAGGNVTKIKLVQGTLASSTPTKPRPRPKPPSPETLAELEAATAGIENEKLRAAIVALGRAVLAESNSSST